MAINKTMQYHDFIQAYERYDEVYEERPYVSGGFFLFFGGINTTYKKDLISYKERPIFNVCRCGEIKETSIHAKKVIQRADRLEPEYIY